MISQCSELSNERPAVPQYAVVPYREPVRLVADADERFFYVALLARHSLGDGGWHDADNVISLPFGALGDTNNRDS